MDYECLAKIFHYHPYLHIPKPSHNNLISPCGKLDNLYPKIHHIILGVGYSRFPEYVVHSFQMDGLQIPQPLSSLFQWLTEPTMLLHVSFYVMNMPTQLAVKYNRG
jgi:hypothetical protein